MSIRIKNKFKKQNKKRIVDELKLVNKPNPAGNSPKPPKKNALGRKNLPKLEGTFADRVLKINTLAFGD